ncbi:MAG: hypothetical protein M3302_08295, partial [Actinomycetota bacterium]|nr:hypothetical protein [Actinomycetota bacterium]
TTGMAIMNTTITKVDHDRAPARIMLPSCPLPANATVPFERHLNRAGGASDPTRNRVRVAP